MENNEATQKMLQQKNLSEDRHVSLTNAMHLNA